MSRKQEIKFGIDRITNEYRQLKKFEFLKNGKIYRYTTYIKNCEFCNVEFETKTKTSRTDSSKCDAELKFQIWSKLFENDKILASQNYNKSQYTQTVKKYFERKYYYELYVAKITPCCKLNINLLANQGKNTYNGKLCIMNIDHIDNNPLNNKYSNLQYICLFCHAVKTDYRRNIGSNGRLNVVRKELKKLNSLKKTDYSGRGMKLEMEVK
jgi:hypothetical protein